MAPHDTRTEALIERVDRLHREIAARQRDLLETLARLESREAWVDDGARDMAQWTSINLDVSRWKAERWLGAGRAFARLPATADALERGDIGIDKVVELSRFATHDDEDALLRWARTVPSGALRRTAELRARERRREAEQDERTRWLEWRYADDGRRFLLDGELPSAQGAVVARALERIGDQIPAMPGEESVHHAGSRRADALVALCSASLAGHEDQDRATVIVHADLEALYDADANAAIEGGPVIAGPSLHRLLCNARVQLVVERPDGTIAGLGRMSREPTAWMMRQLRHRDGGCRFPGCDARRFTQAHHIEWWSRGGATDLDNLALICSFHHRLLHEHRWSIERADDGELVWRRPGGVRYRAGPVRDVA
ncbi:MAG TPA: DUF222 domain-containing protein [Actinomycetota bacterium]|nr:DUF222 domain-containing protein [Actinomycetota bacterium]